MNKITAIVAATIVFTLSGCSSKKVESCWSAETKESATNIVKQIVEERVAEIIKISSGVPVNDEKKVDIAARAKVELTNFHVQDVNEAGKLTCGAMAHFSYVKQNKETVTGETYLEFSVAKGENRNEVFVAKAPIIMMVNTSE